VEVQEHYAEIRARGAEVVAVAQGSGEESARFCRMMKIGYACLGDPEKALYRGFSLPRDGWWNVTLQPFLDEPRVAFERIRRASLKGSLMRHTDVLQLGGTVVVDGRGIVRYLHRSRRTDDHAPIAEVIAALDALA
jgi:peroxiredoxin